MAIYYQKRQKTLFGDSVLVDCHAVQARLAMTKNFVINIDCHDFASAKSRNDGVAIYN
ncbi:hypothetical protein [Helicobacter sp. T3_23-1056]